MVKLNVYDVSDQRQALKALAELAQRSAMHPRVQMAALAITNDLPSRDDAAEVNAIFNAVKHGDPRVKGLEHGVRYVSDPRWADTFRAPNRTLQMCANGACAGDCLPGDTLLLAAGYKFKAIRDIQPGDMVMGDGRWVKVTSAWDKGIQETLAFKLSNGGVLRCTPSHRVFRVPPGGARESAEEIFASEIKPGDDLLQIDSIPFGVEGLDQDRAWLLGTHIADGWVEKGQDGRPLRFAISGLDGHRKEAQKERVKSICAAMGISTQWAEKYVRVNDRDLAEWLAGCGHGAFEKHVPSLNLTESTVRNLLSGLAADADLRNGVFGTISPELALQYRVLMRMLGVSTHVTRVDEHGGFGSNPIYRVIPRSIENKRRDIKFARVRSVELGETVPTFDIEVEGHRFYLPETDLVVHNCDDHTALVVALLAAIGFRAGLRAWGPRGSGEYTHVYPVVGLPKRDPKEAYGLDTTVPESDVGWEPPNGEILTAWLE